ncbi:4Fe-4S dicluster-binding protein [Chloroflexota bacterium]
MIQIVIAAIGLFCGLLIYIAFIKIPKKVQGLEKTEEIASILPGLNCGGCGYPGCFGFAQALTKDPELINNVSCAFVMHDDAKIKRLEEALGMALDASTFRKMAVVRCTGDSELIYDYQGTKTCRANATIYGGHKKCIFGCLGFGDCSRVCPMDAISTDNDKRIAIIDEEKCTGCGICAKQCPQNLIDLIPVDTKIVYLCNYQSLRDISGREKCSFGCIHCRKCYKACEEEGIHAIEWDKAKASPIINQDKCTICDKCIQVCPQNTLAYSVKQPIHK